MSATQIKCAYCKKSNLLDLYSKANDQNYCTWIFNGKPMEKEGSMPSFHALTDSSGCCFVLCMECGRIQGLNLKALKTAVKTAFAEDVEDDILDPPEQKPAKKGVNSKTQKPKALPSKSHRHVRPQTKKIPLDAKPVKKNASSKSQKIVPKKPVYKKPIRKPEAVAYE